MKKIVFLISLAAFALLDVTTAEARDHHSKHSDRLSYVKHYSQLRDYYPQKPQYPHSPVHKDVASGVLGSVLGYEIAKDDAIASGSTTDTYLNHNKIEKR